MEKKNLDIRIILSPTNNKHIKRFSVRHRLSCILEAYNYLNEVLPYNDNTGFPNEGYLLAERLYQIDGVQKVTVDVYDIYITKGKAFSWREVQDKILLAIREYLSHVKNAKKEIKAAENKVNNNKIKKRP